MRAGRVVILNGTASAGKTSMARAAQCSARDAWVVIGQDEFAQSLVPRWIKVDGAFDGGRGEEGFHFVRDPDGSLHVEVGAAGQRVLRGYRFAVGACARAGNNVIVDECKFDAGGWDEWRAALRDIPTTWVNVKCDLAVCEQREAARTDRQHLVGLARGHYVRVHVGAQYDLAVDLSGGDLERAVQIVLAAVQ